MGSIIHVAVPGIRHSVDVEAESVYEAAFLGLAALKNHAWSDTPGPASRLRVEVHEPIVRHEVTVRQLRAWAESTPKSPAEKVKRDRLLRLLAS